MREIIEHVVQELEGGRPFALVTLVGDRGSTPRATGAQMLVRADGSIAGTIGGGLLEATMMATASEVISAGKSRIASMALRGRSTQDEEMMCGGSALVLLAYAAPENRTLRDIALAVSAAVRDDRRAWLFTAFASEEGETDVSYCLLSEGAVVAGESPCGETELRRLVVKAGAHGTAALPDGRQVAVEAIEPVASAVICGAGHVGQALAPIAAAAGFRVVVLDDRAEFATPDRFPSAAEVIVLDSFDEAFGRPALDDHSYVVIVTRGHRHDASVLEQALRSPARYIGLMSSRTKWKHLAKAMAMAGWSAEELGRVHAPIGLPIGAETPAELAISIVAEMIQVRASST